MITETARYKHYKKQELIHIIATLRKEKTAVIKEKDRTKKNNNTLQRKCRQLRKEVKRLKDLII